MKMMRMRAYEVCSRRSMAVVVVVVVVMLLGVICDVKRYGTLAAEEEEEENMRKCANILRSNAALAGRIEDVVTDSRSSFFNREGLKRSRVSAGWLSRYSGQESGPFSVGTGFARVSLDNPAESPLMTRLIRQHFSTQNVFNDPGRQTTGLITAQLHFPKELINAGARLPIIILAPPLQVANEFIASLFQTDTFIFVLEYFASHGFMTITTTEVSSKAWNEGAEIKIGNRVLDLLRFVEAQSERSGSWLENRYNGFAGAYGVSMGGGASLYVSTLADANVAAAAVLVPSYFGADPSDDRGGFGAYNVRDLKVPVLAVGADPTTDFLIDEPCSSYFTESTTPVAAFTLRNTNHFSMTHIRFGLPYMNAFFTLHLKNNNDEVYADAFGYDYDAAKTIYGDRLMRGSILNNSAVKPLLSKIDSRTTAVVASDPTDVGQMRVVARNLRARNATLCIVEEGTGSELALVGVLNVAAGGAASEPVNITSGRRRLALIDVEDYATTFVNIKE